MKDQQRSLVTLVGKEKVNIILWILFSVFLALSVFSLLQNILIVSILLVMELILFLIFLFADYFRTNERFRYLGDAIFFLPIVILLL